MDAYVHCIHICHVNSFIVAKPKESVRVKRISHFIWSKLWTGWHTLWTFNPLESYYWFHFSSKPNRPRRVCMSSTNPQLPACQFSGNPEQHVFILGKEQRACTYCNYVYAIATMHEVNPLSEVARPSRQCFLCNNHQGSIQFNQFHRKGDA
jgi:hypothetical protein